MEHVIRQGCLKLCKTESSCDVILCCQGFKITAHKLILSIASPVFRNLLLHFYTEPAVIILPDVKGNIMSLIIDYIYSGSVIVNSNDVGDFLNAAELLKLNVDENYLEQCKKYEVLTKTQEHDANGNVVTKDWSFESKRNKPEALSCAIEKPCAKRELKRIPDLISISELRSTRFKHLRKMRNQVIPSPWCPRLSSVLADPRSDRPKCSEIQAESVGHIQDTENNNNVIGISYSGFYKCNDNTIKRKPTTSFPVRQSESNKVHSEKMPLSDSSQTVTVIDENSEPDSYQECDISKWTSKSNLLYKSQASKPNSSKLNKVQNPCDLSMQNNNIIDDGRRLEQCCPCNNNVLLEENKRMEAVIAQNSKTHIGKAENQKSYECQQCGKLFSQLRNYKYHRSIHEGTKEFAAKCEECGKVFNDRGYLSSHMKIHRDKKEYACPHCPKRFNQRVAFNMHLRIHTGIKPHKCSTCGKSFSRKMLLKQHQRVHTGEKPYACPVCGKTFADRSNMSLHIRLHTGVKPYVCSLCPKSFTKKHHLKTHMNFHTGLKPYACDNCGLTFSQSSNMRTHYKKCLLKDTSQSSVTNVS